MSTILTIKAGGESRDFKLGPTDLWVLSSLAENPATKSASAHVFGAELGEWSVDRQVFDRDCAHLLESLDHSCDGHSHFYLSMRAHPLSESSGEHTTCTGVSGLHIDGRRGAIWGGLGECILELYDIAPNGRPRTVSKTDIRSWKDVHSEDFGRIAIRRRRADAGIRRILKSLRRVAQATNDERVELVHA